MADVGLRIALVSEYECTDPPLCVDTGDQNSVKQALDDSLMKAVAHLGYIADERQQNMKLKLMVFACAVASMAQFWDKVEKRWEFPKNMTLLYVCTSLYFTASGILQYIMMYMERDVLGFYNNDPEDPKAEERQQAGVAVHSTFGRFTDQYEVTLARRDGTGKCLSKEYSVGEFFDIDGNQDEMEWVKAVQTLVDRFNRGDTDEKSVQNTSADMYPNITAPGAASSEKQKSS
eukprot:g3290.t1